MNDNSKHAAVRSSNKIFLAGRIVRVAWNDADAQSEILLCVFANDGWVRFTKLPGYPGYIPESKWADREDDPNEFLTPACNIWRIENVHEKA